jgi:CubicO group peptidase (beta-lactamase class C family)
VRRFAAVFLLVVGLAAPAAAEQDAFDEFVTEIMSDWGVPGLALARIEQGKIVSVRHYGLRDTENALPVEPGTLFAIGSITKTFTAAGLAMLVDEERLTWDTRVIDILPDFQLTDPIATELATLEDLLTHRTGMARHDRLWYLTSLSRDELYARLKHLAPRYTFREAFQYNNLMYTVAGRIIERLSGESWEAYVAKRLLSPLGLTRTLTSTASAAKDGNHALPYAEQAGATLPITLYDTSSIAPAGGLHASVGDIGTWLALQLGRGAVGGTRLVSEERMAEMQSPRVFTGGAADWPALRRNAYGLGMVIGHYRGRTLASHAGGMDGFVAHFSFMPEIDAGIVVFANLDRTPAPKIIARRFYDEMLGLPPIPWNDDVHAKYEAAYAAMAAEDAEIENSRLGPPPRTLTDYVGAYENAGYGPLIITEEGHGLTLEFGRLTLPLRHHHGDVFEIEQIPLTSARHVMLTFSADAAGNITRVDFPFESEIAPIEFVRN